MLRLSGEISNWKVRATGFSAGCIIAAGAVLFICLYADPFGDPGHFVAALLTAFAAGVALGFAVNYGRIADVLNEKECYRQEVNRMAESKRILEEKFLKRRLSSIPSRSLK